MSTTNHIDGGLRGNLAASYATLGQTDLYPLDRVFPALAQLARRDQPHSNSPVRSKKCAQLAFEFGVGRQTIFEMNAQKNL